MIYHLFRALDFRKGETVLVPDYHSGVEVWAIRAAGASIRYYHIGRNLEPDLDELVRLCRSNARALYVIHFLGWPQPLKELVSLGRERGMILIEDCALSLLSEADGRPLGSFGDYAIFCLYKTLPVPNGGLLVQNRNVLDGLTKLELKAPGIITVAGRSMDLFLERIRSRANKLGEFLFWLKRVGGQALTLLGVTRLPVGDISPQFSSVGFELGNVNIGMSSFCHALLKRFDYEGIRRRRRENFLLLHERLAGKATVLRNDLGEGVCPLFFPILVPDKASAARALWQRGIGAVEFWNYGYPEAKGETFPDARFLRDHLLELPIHQDISPSQVKYMAEQILELRLHF